MNKKHLKWIIKNSHRITIPEVTKKYGYKRNMLTYYAKKYDFSFKKCDLKINKKYDQADIDKISKYYLKNGFKKTVEKFPEFNVKSVNQIYMLNKGIRFRKNGIPTFEEKLFKLRYDEFLETKNKAKMLSQSGIKRVRYSQFMVNGKSKTCFGFSFNTMAFSLVKHLLKKNINTIYINRTKYKEVVTWIEISKNIISKNKDMVIIARSMAKFQKWLHNNDLITNQEKICKRYQESRM